jgi:hypothetical protein
MPLRLAILVLIATAMPAFAQFPQQGVDGMENGVAAPFVGKWRMSYPEDEDTIVAVELIGCERPIVIDALGNSRFHYLSPNNPEDARVEVDLTPFMNRTVWFPRLGGPNYLSIWLGPDAFHLHNLGETGAADWDNPFLYRRCP